MTEGIAEIEKRLDQGTALIDEQTAELGRQQARIDELDAIADRLAERVVGRERELEWAQRELDRLRTADDARLAALAAIADELEQLRGQARGQATRIRLSALRQAAELTERISELTQGPTGARERLVDALAEAIGRVGSTDVPPEPTPSVPARSNGHAPQEPRDIFNGSVQIDIGPLSDFSQLVGFEDAAGAIGATSQISVRRFTQGRATLDLKLAEPVELLRELEERAPFEFRVRDTRADRLVLDLDGE